MATFKAQVDAITGMVSGTTEGALTDNELKQVISDGIMELWNIPPFHQNSNYVIYI